MKKFEMYVENILLILFVYSLLLLMVVFAGYYKDNQIFIYMRHINPLLVLAGLITSAITSYVFPLWNIYDEYRYLKVGEIIKLERRYKRNYKRLFVGFLILVILSKSAIAFDFYFYLGFISMTSYLFYLFIWKKIKKSKIFKIIVNKIKSFNKKSKKENCYLKLRIDN